MSISEQEFKSYAALILHLVAVEKDDFVLIRADMGHKNLVAQLYAQAYKRGASYVHISVGSGYFNGLRASNSHPEYLEIIPESIIGMYKEFVDKKACIISVRSPEDPAVNQDVSTEHMSTINNANSKAMQFLRKSVMSDGLSWIVTDCPTKGWAKNVYPDIPSDEGEIALWNAMKKILRLDQDDPIAAWEKQQENILKKKKILNQKEYRTLHFLSEGTDFKVGVHKKSVWLGAAHTSQNGKYFQANVPTEEVYTSPDCRYTEGTVSIKRPLPIFGKRVEGITMRFKEGRLEEAYAEVGNDSLQAFINSDERNRYLGEIAMVGIDSPIWQSGLIFNSILYDENAGVHFALGSAYPTGYGFGAEDNTSAEEYIAMGLNTCNFHLDFVIGDENMTVYGILEDGTKELIMEQGLFIDELV